jgi:hypothetical protein
MRGDLNRAKSIILIPLILTFSRREKGLTSAELTNAFGAYATKWVGLFAKRYRKTRMTQVGSN